MAKKKSTAAQASQAPGTEENGGQGKARKADQVGDLQAAAPASKKQKKVAAPAVAQLQSQQAQQRQQPPQQQGDGGAAQPAGDGEGGKGGGAKEGKKGGSEIDELFGQLGQKKKGGASKAVEGRLEGEKQEKAEKKAPKVEGSKDDIFGTEAGKARKRTEEGYAIYSEEELGLHRKDAGNTDLCPFDCTCCY